MRAKDETSNKGEALKPVGAPLPSEAPPVLESVANETESPHPTLVMQDSLEASFGSGGDAAPVDLVANNLEGSGGEAAPIDLAAKNLGRSGGAATPIGLAAKNLGGSEGAATPIELAAKNLRGFGGAATPIGLAAKNLGYLEALLLP